MNNNRFRRQFLLTTQTSVNFSWKRFDIKEYTLHFHPELAFTRSIWKEKELIMLGSMYDWETPAQTNQHLLDSLVRTGSFENFWAKLSTYAGQYVILYRDKSHFLLFNDACAQHEIYYDSSLTTFGSQPKLICEIIESEPHTRHDAIEFYSSREFFSKKLFVRETTHHGNIKHLLPNHYIDINKKTTVRYFPSEPVARFSIKEVAPRACQMLRGYIKAVAMRKKIAMAVTGGYDSRVLFLASLDEDCEYFVLQHKNMTAKHYDVVVPQRLTKLHKRQFEVIPDAETFEEISDSIDFPRAIPKASKYFENHIYLNGSISEIARSFYGFDKMVSADDLAFINGYGRFAYVVGIYGQWLENAVLFKKYAYNVLDMFYWEERTGIWVAKEKTMMNAFGMVVFSPFCSRDLLTLLLSTPRKDRDKHINRLYNAILLELSPHALKIPINPSLKSDVIRLMTRLKIYATYRNLGLKYKALRY